MSDRKKIAVRDPDMPRMGGSLQRKMAAMGNVHGIGPTSGAGPSTAPLTNVVVVPESRPSSIPAFVPRPPTPPHHIRPINPASQCPTCGATLKNPLLKDLKNNKIEMNIKKCHYYIL